MGHIQDHQAKLKRMLLSYSKMNAAFLRFLGKIGVYAGFRPNLYYFKKALILFKNKI